MYVRGGGLVLTVEAQVRLRPRTFQDGTFDVEPP